MVPAAPTSPAHGLIGVEDRVEELGGLILLDSPRGGGDQPARRAPAEWSTGGLTAVARQITWNVRCWFILFGPKLRLWVIDSG